MTLDTQLMHHEVPLCRAEAATGGGAQWGRTKAPALLAPPGRALPVLCSPRAGPILQTWGWGMHARPLPPRCARIQPRGPRSPGRRHERQDVPRRAAPAPGTHSANSLGSSWSLGGQALISGMKNASAAHKKAPQTPAAGAWCSKGRKMLPENARRAGEFKNPPLQRYTSQ